MHIAPYSLIKEINIKEIIIRILSEEFPLTIKKIHNRIRKNYKKRISYQAVYKAVYELINKKILMKKTKEYSLSKDYIEHLSNFIDKLKLNYKKEKDIYKELSEKNLVIKKLNSQYEMALFILEMLKSVNKGDIVTIIWPTTWPPLTVPENINSSIKELRKKAEAFCISGGEGFLDTQFAKFWNKLGMKIKIGIKLNRVFDTIIFKDITILIYQPPEKRLQKYKYINLIKGLTTLDRDKFFLKIIKEKAEIYAIVIKNPALADKLKQEVMSYF